MASYDLYKFTKKDNFYMKYYKPINIPYDKTDYVITIEKKYINYPKKLSYDLYGTTELSWIFKYFNKEKIKDPIFDLKEGISIRVPTKTRLLSYF